jgi:putative peptidoglycan lipid II flippase
VVYPFAGVTAFDPFGTDGEHDSQIPLATDGNPQTYWTTENYNDLNLAPKPGVGLLFDLGAPKAVAGFRLQTPFPGYEFQVRVGDDPTALSTTRGAAFTAQSDMTQNITPTTGRYVLLWITTVVPGVDHGNRAAVGEFHVFGG